jgi:hypothetical protein
MKKKIDLAESQFMITVNYDSQILIDNQSVGNVKKGEFGIFKVFPGEHYIEARSLDGKWNYKGLHSVQLGYQEIVELVLLPADVSIGLSGTFKDQRDNRTYKTVKINGKTWLAENLKYPIHRSWCYGNNQNNCTNYGRLYHLDYIKDACPNGWHIPNRTEWQALIQLYSNETLINDLKPGGMSNFNLQFSGNIWARMSNNAVFESYELGQTEKFWLDEPTVVDGHNEKGMCAAFTLNGFSIEKNVARQHGNQYCNAISLRCVKDD